MRTLKSILWGMGSQSSFFRTGIVWSYFLVSEVRWAAEFAHEFLQFNVGEYIYCEDGIAAVLAGQYDSVNKGLIAWRFWSLQMQLSPYSWKVGAFQMIKVWGHRDRFSTNLTPKFLTNGDGSMSPIRMLGGAIFWTLFDWRERNLV